MTPLEETTRRIVATACGADPSAIALDRPLLEYGLDSARAIDVVVSLEDEYRISITDEEASRLRTLSDLLAFLSARIGR